MINKHKQVVCDVSKIILEDGVTLFPGYVEVKNGIINVYYSDDRNNPIPNKTLLKNRVEFKRAEYWGKAEKGIKDGHYASRDVMLSTLK